MFNSNLFSRVLLSLYVLVSTNIPAVTEGASREVVPDPGDPMTFEISLFDQNMLKSFGSNNIDLMTNCR